MSVFPHRDGKRLKVVVNYPCFPGHCKTGRHQIAKLAPTQREASRIERQFLNRRDAGELPYMQRPPEPTPGMPTFREYGEQWLAVRLKPGRNQVRDSTARRYRDCLRRASAYLGDTPLDQIDALTIEACLDVMRDEGLQESTLGLTYRVMRSIFRAASIGRTPVITYDPFPEVRNAPRRITREMTIPTSAELDSVIEAADRRGYGAFIRFLALTGARLGEALALTWADVDLDGARVTIRHSMNKWNETNQTKTGKSRRITLDGATVHMLRGVIERQYVDRMNAPLGTDGKSLYREGGYVFCNVLGDPWTQNKVEVAWYRVRREADVTFRLHDLRHAHASYLLSSGVPVTKVAERLGHKSVNTTLSTYAHALPSDDDRVIEAIDRVYGSK